MQGIAVSDRPAVVVLNTHYTGLGIVRNLAHLGLDVYTLSANKEFPGNRSRFAKFLDSPDSLENPGELRDYLVALSKRIGGRPVLFPTRDHDINFINDYRPELEAHFIIPFSGKSVIDAIMDKKRCQDVAAGLGIVSPRTWKLNSEADLTTIRAEATYPVIVKPLNAALWRKPGIWDAVGRQKVIKIERHEELVTFHRRVAAYGAAMLVQEWIPGPEQNLLIFGSYRGRDGEIQASFTARKLLQYPELYGTGVVVEAATIESIVEPSRRLLEALDFHGVSEIEYKFDPRTNTPKLIEINPRHWDQHRLGTAVGVNLTVACYSDVTGEPTTPAVQSGENVRWIAGNEYFMHVLRSLAGRSSLRECLRLFGGKHVFPIWDWRDAKPGLNQLGHLAANIYSSAVAALRSRSPRQAEPMEPAAAAAIAIHTGMATDHASLPEPFFLSAGGRSLFAIYHRPTSSAGNIKGNVLCVAPFNEEMNRCRTMLTRLASALGECGFGTLIVDLYGTGDSEGEYRDARWTLWREDIVAAADWLSAQVGGCSALLGVRLGAMLAADVLRGGWAPCRTLLLWQPIIDGGQHFTQFLRMRIAAQMDRRDLPKETTQSMREKLAAGQAVEISGYEIHPELAAAIDKANLADLVPPAGSSVLWLEQATQGVSHPTLAPASRKLIHDWTSGGLQVASELFEGPAFWQQHQRVLAPDAVRKTVTWLSSEVQHA
jgi:exosortase A-associated hydrolase 2